MKGTCLMRTYGDRSGRCYQAEVLAVSLRIPELFGSPARASLALAEAATSWTSPVCRLAGLYERPAPARVHVRVRLPSASRQGVDKLVHGQGTSIINRQLALIRTRPYPHTSCRCKVLEGSPKIHIASRSRPYSKSNKTQPYFSDPYCT